MTDYQFTVRGSWPFPLDMLRYDQCRAATPDDQTLIDRLSAENATDKEDFKPVDINLAGPVKPTIARWESFMWRVPGDYIWDYVKQGKIEAAKRETLIASARAKLTSEEIEAINWHHGINP